MNVVKAVKRSKIQLKVQNICLHIFHSHAVRLVWILALCLGPLFYRLKPLNVAL